MQLDNAVADDVVKVLTAISQQSRQQDPGAAQPVVISDPRSNSIIIGGDKSERDKLVTVIKQLDHPSKDLGDTQVIYLNYADAQNLAPILEGYAQQVSKPASSKSGSMFSTSGSSGGAGSQQSQPTPAPTSTQTSYTGGNGNGDLRVLADKDTNSLVITAPPKTMQKLRAVIAKLDIRRAQILVEAIIAEVSATKSSDLGIDWIAFNPSSVAAAGILNPNTATALSNISSGLTSTLGTTTTSTLNNSTLIGAGASLLSTGATALVGSRSGSNIYGALLHALQTDGDTNILSTPTLVTLDNEEAKIEVGQEVPVLTGSFANTGTVSNGAVNPFQTVDRKDVGLKLGITPTIGEGNSIRLKIEFENSNISSGQAGSSNLITNKRTVSNTVSIEGGQILVIGGLIDDQINDSQNRIPFLSDIPLIGSLFKSRSITHTKSNLMIFVHPVVLRERTEGDYFSRKKYEETRQSELRAANGPVPVVGGQRPVLYDYDDYMRKSNLPAGIAVAPPPASAPGEAPVAPGMAPPPAPSATPQSSSPAAEPAKGAAGETLPTPPASAWPAASTPAK